MLLIDDKFLIIHVPKSGGTSFCEGLVGLLPPDRVHVLGYTEEGETRSQEGFAAGGLWKHSTALDVLKRTPEKKCHSYRKLLVSVRPHYERVASYYFHMRRHNERYPDRYPYVRSLTLSQYIRSKHAHFKSIVDYCTDEARERIVDQLVEFKNLGRRYTRLAGALGFPNQKLPRINMAPEQINYSKCYTPKDRKLIDERFADEIKFLERMRAAR